MFMNATRVGRCLTFCLTLVGTIAYGRPGPDVSTPPTAVLLAGGQATSDTRLESDSDDDDSWPSRSHQRAGKGQNPRVDVIAPPGGYQAKRLNRLWGRFRGAKRNEKAEKRRK
jgi:hypothetical protein